MSTKVDPRLMKKGVKPAAKARVPYVADDKKHGKSEKDYDNYVSDVINRTELPEEDRSTTGESTVSFAIRTASNDGPITDAVIASGASDSAASIVPPDYTVKTFNYDFMASKEQVIRDCAYLDDGTEVTFRNEVKSESILGINAFPLDSSVYGFRVIYKGPVPTDGIPHSFRDGANVGALQRIDLDRTAVQGRMTGLVRKEDHMYNIVSMPKQPIDRVISYSKIVIRAEDRELLKIIDKYEVPTDMYQRIIALEYDALQEAARRDWLDIYVYLFRRSHVTRDQKIATTIIQAVEGNALSVFRYIMNDCAPDESIIKGVFERCVDRRRYIMVGEFKNVKMMYEDEHKLWNIKRDTHISNVRNMNLNVDAPGN